MDELKAWVGKWVVDESTGVAGEVVGYLVERGRSALLVQVDAFDPDCLESWSLDGTVPVSDWLAPPAEV